VITVKIVKMEPGYISKVTETVVRQSRGKGGGGAISQISNMRITVKKYGSD
jgi:hypothetical protein